MKKKIYVGCIDKNIKYLSLDKYSYSYLTIDIFIEKLTQEGLTIIGFQASNKYISGCSNTYRIIFNYKFKERNQFKEKLIKVETDPLIVKYFKIV